MALKQIRESFFWHCLLLINVRNMLRTWKFIYCWQCLLAPSTAERRKILQHTGVIKAEGLRLEDISVRSLRRIHPKTSVLEGCVRCRKSMQEKVALGKDGLQTTSAYKGPREAPEAMVYSAANCECFEGSE